MTQREPLDGLIIRAPLADELTLLPAIELAAETLFPPERLLPAQAAVPLDLLAKAREDECLWVAELEQTIVGFCVAEILGDDLHIVEIDVLPDFGKRGIGRALLNGVFTGAIKKGCQRVTLTTFSDFPWNAAFYKTMGFVEISPTGKEARLSAQLAKERAQGYTKRVAMIKTLP